MNAPDQTAAHNNSSPARRDTILVVDDQVEMRMILESALTHAGFRVLMAGSAAQGCDLVRREEADLILLDWDLREGKTAPDEPGLGSDVLAVCRQVDPLLPVVVMSGNTHIDVPSDALPGGAISFLYKPLSATVLTSHIRLLLQRNRKASSLFRLENEGDIIPLDELKDRYVRLVVELLEGNICEAARRLGVQRQTVTASLGEGRHAVPPQPLPSPPKP